MVCELVTVFEHSENLHHIFYPCTYPGKYLVSSKSSGLIQLNVKAADIVFALTSIRRVGCRAVEEGGRASEVGHAGVVGVAVHGAAD